MDSDKNKSDEKGDADDSWQRHDRLFDDLEEDEFDDSDRDSDFAAMYTEVEEDEDEDEELVLFDDSLEDEPDTDLPADSESPWDEPAADADDDWEDQASSELEIHWEPSDEPSPEPDPDPDPDFAPFAEQGEFGPGPAPLPRLAEEFPEDDDNGWEEEETDYYADEPADNSLPLGLILVGLIALVLVGVGGYGVIQQRQAMQDEIRQLQSNLATAANPAEVAAGRAASEAIAERNQELEAQLEQLTRENSNLQSIVAGLEKQLAAQEEALGSEAAKAEPKAEPKPAAAAKPQPKPKPKPKPKAAPKPEQPAKPDPAPVTTNTQGDWFVNFGSYSQKGIAQHWADKLQPTAGKVVLATGDKDGRTFYRVRVIGLPSREQAESTARSLEQAHDMSKLWIGRSN
jgi:cell division septation protein DedD